MNIYIHVCDIDSIINYQSFIFLKISKVKFQNLSTLILWHTKALILC